MTSTRNIVNILYTFTAMIIRLICTINGGLVVKGKENVPAEGGAIIAPNHISYLDPPVIGASLPRKAIFIARKGLFNIPVLGFMIKQTAIPIDREKASPSTIKQIVRYLKNDELVVIFPEGRRSETGELLEAKRGIGMIATFSKVPVIPAYITGTEKALPIDAKFLKRSRITVVFGKPIYFNSTKNKDRQHDHTLHEEISNMIMDSLRELKKTWHCS